MLFGAMGIVGFINSSRINKIARKYPSLPGWSEISQSDRKEIRKYFLYIILSLISFLIERPGEKDCVNKKDSRYKIIAPANHICGLGRI